jgi:acetyl esterase/lipase
MLILVLMALCSVSWAADAPTGNMPQDMQVGPTGQMTAKNLEVPDHIQLDRDIVFATIDGSELKLDIAYPKAKKEKLSAVVYIHGGGFEMGDKPTDQTVLFAENGFVGIAIQYRLSGVATFPAAVHDCKTAIRWTRANAKTYGIDPDRIGVIGESAGGYLVALMGTSGGDAYLEGDGLYGGFSSSVQAVVDLFGPIDFGSMEDAPGEPLAKFLGKPAKEVPELVKKSNPLTYVDAGDAPTLMIHGEEDNLVPIVQSELLYSALSKAGVQAEVVRVKNAGHGFSAATPGAVVSPSLEEIEALEVQWFRKVFGMK